MLNLESSEIGFQFRFENRFGIARRESAESRSQMKSTNLGLCLSGLLMIDDISEILYDMLDLNDLIALSSTSIKYIWNLQDCALHISPKYSLAFADSLIQPIYRKFAHLTIAMTTKRSFIKLPESVLSLNLSGEINGLQISGSSLQSLTMTDAFPRSLACSRLQTIHFVTTNCPTPLIVTYAKRGLQEIQSSVFLSCLAEGVVKGLGNRSS
jgi:hypothetical protein